MRDCGEDSRSRRSQIRGDVKFLVTWRETHDIMHTLRLTRACVLRVVFGGGAMGGDTPFLAMALRLVSFHFASLFIARCNRCGGQLPGARECGRATAPFTSSYNELIAE